MADVVVEWQGLTLGGSSSPYYVQSITGWDDLPEVTSYDEPRSRGHGDHVGDQFSRARIVTVEGTIADPAARNDLARALAAVSTVRSDVADLTVTTFGDVLTAGARLLRRSMAVQVGYGAGLIPFALQWRCPDPLRYSAAGAPLSTGLPTSGGGMAFPMAFPMDFGASGDPGRIVLTNTGTAPAPVVFEVTGGLPGGWEVSSSTGGRLVYPVAVPAGQVLTGDTATGTLLAEGTADRRANLTVADWGQMQVPPMSSLTLQFTSLGGAYDAAARLTVPEPRSAYW